MAYNGFFILHTYMFLNTVLVRSYTNYVYDQLCMNVCKLIWVITDLIHIQSGHTVSCDNSTEIRK